MAVYGIVPVAAILPVLRSGWRLPALSGQPALLYLTVACNTRAGGWWPHFVLVQPVALTLLKAAVVALVHQQITAMSAVMNFCFRQSRQHRS